ncbi:MAG: PilZ domain-containing protein [Candidatus Omnitrophota bacterium]
MLENRKYPRYDKDLEVRYSTVGLTAIESESVTQNVSQSGIRFHVSRLIKAGDALNLLINSPGKGESPIRASGKVVWTRESGKFDVEAGLAFTKIDSRDASRLVTVA